MNLNIMCSVALVFSLLLFVLSAVIGAVLHRMERKNKELGGKRRVFSPFQVFVLCFFLATVAILFPVYYADYFKAEAGFLKVVKSLLLSMQNVLRLITLDGDFDNIRDFLLDPSRINPVLGETYSIYSAILFIAAPILTAGFLLSFFRNASSMLRYSLRPCRELYVMSELNERSLALAKNILGEGKGGRIVVFTDVFEKGEEQTYERIYTARQMGAICVKKDVVDLGLKYARKCTRKVYLIGDDEDENVKQALKLINRHRGKKYDNKNLAFYVFSKTVESEALLDSIEKGKMIVRRVNESHNLALLEMQAHPIFKGLEPIDGVKQIRLAIVGIGGYGTELLKAVCCLGQMPGYKVEVHVFDKENVKARIKAVAPDFIALNGDTTEGEAQYNIVFHRLRDIGKKGFIEQFSSVDGYTGVYVTLGEDEMNIETAIRVRQALRKKDPREKTPIYAVVYDPTKVELMAEGGLKTMSGEAEDNGDYDITFIGSLSECFSLKNIEQAELEKSAKELHLNWAKKSAQNKKEAIIQAEESFDRFEYNRRSSMMQAVYENLREGCGIHKMDEDTPEGRAQKDLLRLYEHRRWNVYMRGEGYVHGEHKSHVAKTHPQLHSYNELPETERKKDDF